MLARRIVLAASVIGLSLAGAASPAPAHAQGPAGPPRLVARCYAQDLAVSSSFAPFEAQAKKWIATCVSAGREEKLVAGNASLRSVYDNVKHLAGKNTRVTTDFGFKNLGGGSFGVETVTFKTDVKAPAPPAPPAPTPATSPYASSTILDVADPLPANLEDELKVALVRVRAAIDEDAGAGKNRQLAPAQANRLRCQLTKLANPKMDDREISWAAACGELVPTYTATQCAQTKDLRVKDEVKSKADLDTKDLWFLYHLRPEIVNVSRRLFAGHGVKTAASVLNMVDSDRYAAVHGLRRMGERTQGFLAAPHYLHLNDWVSKEQDDPNSVYSCR